MSASAPSLISGPCRATTSACGGRWARARHGRGGRARRQGRRGLHRPTLSALPGRGMHSTHLLLAQPLPGRGVGPQVAEDAGQGGRARVVACTPGQAAAQGAGGRQARRAAGRAAGRQASSRAGKQAGSASHPPAKSSRRTLSTMVSGDRPSPPSSRAASSRSSAVGGPAPAPPPSSCRRALSALRLAWMRRTRAARALSAAAYRVPGMGMGKLRGGGGGGGKREGHGQARSRLRRLARSWPGGLQAGACEARLNRPSSHLTNRALTAGNASGPVQLALSKPTITSTATAGSSKQSR